MIGLPDGRKTVKIGLAVLIQYQRVSSSQPPSQPRCRSKYRAYYVARVKRVGPMTEHLAAARNFCALSDAVFRQCFSRAVQCLLFEYTLRDITRVV